jgi:hypothetical protein
VGTTGIDEVLAELDRVIASALDTGDRAGYFAVLYRKVTAKVKEGVEDGFFDDAGRMERLDSLFAERYFDAVTARRQGGRPTASWQLTFDAGARRRPLVLQHLLAGINAHINLDLAIATARCSPGDELPALRRDYDRINAILASMIATLSDELRTISPWMTHLYLIGARTQTEAVRFSIETARGGAWRWAERLAATPEHQWEREIASRDARVACVGYCVLHPGPLTSTGLALVRLRERNDVRANLRHLLGAPEPSLHAVAASLAGRPSADEAR